MANHTRHFKIGFWGYHLYHANEPELVEAEGLWQFLVRGMQFTYDPIDKYDYSDLSEIDIGITHYLPVTEDEERFNLNYPYHIEEVTFAVRNPEYSPRIMALFQTLSPTVWLSLLASTILFALVCYVALKHRHTFQDVLLHVLAICLNQEGNVVSKRAADFILLCTWLVSMAFFTLCFKSVLLSFLSFPPVVGVRTVPELAAAIRAGEYIAYTFPVTLIAYDLSESPNEDIRVIGQSMVNTRWNSPSYLFAEHIEPENYIAFPKKAYVHFRSYMSIPGVYVSKENLRIQSYATFVGKDFCCKDEVDRLVHRFMASGIGEKIRHFREHTHFMREYNIFQKYSIPLENAEDEENRKLTLTDLGGAFILLLVGHFLSICLLIIELLTKRREKSLFKKRKTNLRMVSLSERAQP